MTQKQEIFTLMGGRVRFYRGRYNPTADAVWLAAFGAGRPVKTVLDVGVGTGGAALGVYLISMFPKLDAFLPARLLRGMELLQRAKSPEDYYAGITAAGLMVLLCMVLSVGCFDWKQL